MVKSKRNPIEPTTLFTLLAFVCFAAVLFIPIKTALNRYDEGFAVFGAARVLRGDLPYKDFWAIYPPGQFYAIAFIFDRFGENLLVSRVYDTFVRLGIVIAIYLLARKIMSPVSALLACGIAVVLLASAGFYSYAVFPALMLALCSLLSLTQYHESKQLKYLFLTGVLIGCASLFRWDIALYACATAILALSLLQVGGSTQNSRTTDVGSSVLTVLGLSALLLGGALLIAAPLYGYLISKTGFNDLWAQMVVFPTTQLHASRWIPYPSIVPQRDEYGEFRLGEWLRFYLPLATYSLAFLGGLIALFRKRVTFDETQWFCRITLAVFGAFLFVQALSRYDYIHVIPTSLMMFVLAISLLDVSWKSIKQLRSRYVLILPVLGIVVIYFNAPLTRLITYATDYSPLECHSTLEKAKCVYLSPDQQQAVQYIQRHTDQNEAIFVGSPRHDLVFVNDISFYFLSDRPSATSYHELHPGVATTLAVQKVIVDEIETKDVNWLILVHMGQSNEPNASSISSGVHYLDNHIRGRFSLVERVGAYEIWKRAR